MLTVEGMGNKCDLNMQGQAIVQCVSNNISHKRFIVGVDSDTQFHKQVLRERKQSCFYIIAMMELWNKRVNGKIDTLLEVKLTYLQIVFLDARKNTDASSLFLKITQASQ